MSLTGDIICLNALTLMQIRGLVFILLSCRTLDVGNYPNARDSWAQEQGLEAVCSLAVKAALTQVQTPILASDEKGAIMNLQTHLSAVKESAAGLEGPLSRAARLGI